MGEGDQVRRHQAGLAIGVHPVCTDSTASDCSLLSAPADPP